MAVSARIPIDRTKILGSALSDVISFLEVGRQKLDGLNALLQGATGYNGDNSSTGAQPDFGASVTTTQAQTLMNLITQANNEMSGVFSTAVALNATGGTRQLIDAVSQNR